MPKRAKKSFILLELLVAITLITTCLTPLAMSPVVSFQKNTSIWEEARLAREARLYASEIRAKLLSHSLTVDKGVKILEEGFWKGKLPYKIEVIKRASQENPYHGIDLAISVKKNDHHYYFLIKDEKTE